MYRMLGEHVSIKRRNIGPPLSGYSEYTCLLGFNSLYPQRNCTQNSQEVLLLFMDNKQTIGWNSVGQMENGG